MTISSLLFARARLKVLSLLFAAVLWLFVMLQASGEQEFTVVLQPANISSELSVVMHPPRLQARLGGARILLLRQQLIGLNAEIDLRQRGAGAVRFESIESYLRVVPGLKVLGVTPEPLEIIINQKK